MMRKFGRNLLGTISISGLRIRKDETGVHGGGTAGTGGNNGAENSGGGGTGESNQNNSGQEFKPTAFWDDPEPENKNSGIQQPQNQNQNQNQNEGGNDLGSAIENRVKQFTAAAVMTPETMEAIGNGDYTKFEAGLNQAIQGSMKENLNLVVQLMGKFGEHLESKFGSMIDKSFDGRDSKAFLREQIPTSKNEGVQPIIDSLYDRALVVAKGNKAEAIAMTKRMMRAMSEDTATDLNLHVAPVGSDSNPAPTKKTNWLETLNMS
jgi:hypothetical protein